MEILLLLVLLLVLLGAAAAAFGVDSRPSDPGEVDAWPFDGPRHHA